MAVRWERAGDVGVAIIDRPERRNALNAELCDELVGHLVASPGLRAVVVTGAGEKAFCAGADLGRRAADTQASSGFAAGRRRRRSLRSRPDVEGGLEHGGGDTFRPAFERLVDTIVDYPAPVIAGINGAALGAGMQLAVACDLRVVAPHATFAIPSARLGVLLSAPNIARLAALVGQAMARDLLLSGRALDIDEASQVGLVQRRAPDALAGARELAEEISALAPLSVAGHKRALNLVALCGAMDDAARSELTKLEARAFSSDDLQEGLAAFAEKRPPRFDGR